MFEKPRFPPPHVLEAKSQEPGTASFGLTHHFDRALAPPRPGAQLATHEPTLIVTEGPLKMQ